jgi:hypothetical protein
MIVQSVGGSRAILARENGMWRWGMATLAAFVSGYAAELHAAEFKVETQDGKTRLLLTGKIMPGDAGKFVAAVRNAKNKGSAVTIVVLNSVGGSGRDSITIAKAVRAAKMTTSVPADAICASGCFIVFAGGIERTVEVSSRFGVHAAGQNGRETAGSRAHTQEIARVLKSFDVPQTIVGKVIATPHKDIASLTLEEMRNMNVTVGGVTAASATAASAASWEHVSANLKEARAALERRDTAAVMRLMRPLADAGDATALAMMGDAYDRQKPANPAEALKFYRLAADKGHAGVQHYLGHVYANGQRGLPRDRAEAYKWLTLAMQRGSLYAPGELSRLEKQMSADELAEGKKRISEWRTNPIASSSWPSQSSSAPTGYGPSQSLINAYPPRGDPISAPGPVPTVSELKAMEAGIP